MTFYDSERMIRKQQKYEISKAYNTIDSLRTKGLKEEEIIKALKILLKDENTEFQAKVLTRAIEILETSKEAE